VKICGSQAEIDSHYSTEGTEEKETDAALDPDAVQKVRVGVEALWRRKQGDADLSSPAQSNQGGDEEHNTR